MLARQVTTMTVARSFSTCRVVGQKSLAELTLEVPLGLQIPQSMRSQNQSSRSNQKPPFQRASGENRFGQQGDRQRRQDSNSGTNNRRDYQQNRPSFGDSQQNRNSSASPQQNRNSFGNSQQNRSSFGSDRREDFNRGKSQGARAAGSNDGNRSKMSRPVSGTQSSPAPPAPSTTSEDDAFVSSFQPGDRVKARVSTLESESPEGYALGETSRGLEDLFGEVTTQQSVKVETLRPRSATSSSLDLALKKAGSYEHLLDPAVPAFGDVAKSSPGSSTNPTRLAVMQAHRISGLSTRQMTSRQATMLVKTVESRLGTSA